MKVFVSEDSPQIRKRLVAMLRTVPGVAVVGEAESVEEALNGVLSTAPDVLLLDLQLANGSGLDVLAGLRKQRPELRVIVLTNFATAQHRQASLDAGAAVFLDKSQEFQRVPQLLRAWLGLPPTDSPEPGQPAPKTEE